MTALNIFSDCFTSIPPLLHPWRRLRLPQLGSTPPSHRPQPGPRANAQGLEEHLVGLGVLRLGEVVEPPLRIGDVLAGTGRSVGWRPGRSRRGGGGRGGKKGFKSMDEIGRKAMEKEATTSTGIPRSEA